MLISRKLAVACLGLVFTFCWAAANPPQEKLPRFTEEREAAALYFVKKNLPELTSFLEQFKKDAPVQYRKEICEIFQVTEILADMSEDTRRQELELKIWVAENRAHLLVAKLSTANEEERKKVQAQLQDLTKHLVSLDMEHLELKGEQLEKELGETREELAKMRENRDKQIKDRFDALVEQVHKRKK
jgi:hypothetical protein